MSIQTHRRFRWIVGLLGLAPAAFLGVIVVASVWVGAHGITDADAIADAVSGQTPWLLLVVQLTLLAALALTGKRLRMAAADWGWRVLPGQRLWREAALGATIGLMLAALYLTVLEPWMTWMQSTFGDYVPAGALLPALGSALLPFFLANVVLAPLVEELLYRGLALPRLADQFGRPVALGLTCVAFGLLHWSGGIWYMLLTGVVAGGVFGGLALWRRSVIAAYAAHLALNLVEFIFVAVTMLTP